MTSNASGEVPARTRLMPGRYSLICQNSHGYVPLSPDGVGDVLTQRFASDSARAFHSVRIADSKFTSYVNGPIVRSSPVRCHWDANDSVSDRALAMSASSRTYGLMNAVENVFGSPPSSAMVPVNIS